MFDGTNQSYFSKKYYNHDIIWNNQESIWYQITGYFPDINKRYYSIFRNDKNAGCRFQYSNFKGKNTLEFIDNKGIGNKMHFNCIQAVMLLNKLSYYDACKLIITSFKLELNNHLVNNNSSLNSFNNTLDCNIKIKFTYNKWDNDNYFNQYGLDAEYLSNQPYYKVFDYWTNNKIHCKLIKNKYDNPRNNDVIAYYFKDTNHVKLYFTNNQDLRWYSNCSNDDIYGWHRITQYDNSQPIYLTSSGKDEMCLNKHFNLQTLALQSESISKLPMKLLNIFKNYTVYILMDNDKQGLKYTNYLANNYSEYNLIPLYYPESIVNSIEYKDVANVCKRKEFSVIKDIIN